MRKVAVVLAVALLGSSVWAQTARKTYPWQHNGTDCTEMMTFCWYGSDIVSDPEVTAHGYRWLAQDKYEKPFEWVTEVRCIKSLQICILAFNQKLIFGGGTITDVSLYYVKEWNDYEIRAVGENDFPPGKECEIDTLLVNREEASVSMLSTPGPAATSKACETLLKPKTVMYRLQLGLQPIQK